MINAQNIFPYKFNPAYSRPVAYFSMEFAIDQALKIYSGGLGFLAGSHLRSAYELKQNLVGIGILWKYGYYDQERDGNARMRAGYVEKNYSFLEDTGIVFTMLVHNSPVFVKAWFLRPDTFGSAPLFLLSTDLPENDDMSKSITNRLYDSNEATRIAQSILLGTGGAILLEQLDRHTEVYHMNEGHSLSLNFHLYSKFKNLEEVKKRVVFTTHTPEAAGNESHSYGILQDMSFFCGLQNHEVHSLLGLGGDHLNYTLAALKFARKANAVSKMHGEVSRDMWKSNPGICEITSITNAQNKTYWKDDILETAFSTQDDTLLVARKKELKRQLFKVVADQTGKLFDEDVLTIVWARRFAGYKRADMIMNDWARFIRLIQNASTPVQIIWAGKPYPEDYGAIDLFNSIIDRIKPFANCAVLTGYELGLSALLKKGSDVWLNNPRIYREASGTSGMTAAINGSINLSIPDGWIPEFAKDMENSFIVAPAEDHLSNEEKDRIESERLLEKIEENIVPMYYNDPATWISIMKNSARDVSPAFESGRMAAQYYELMYCE
ncbi:starch phosphorylase [Arcticibacter pallidicorallinus]|uniref:Starch phosphorylase n=1 Tax=Arcticibacter pallidicorallinus TaxID=1259464 RepID=A0A2T0U7T1_9SPHI|nr:alpha-glucan family phosphorylase [Arcticibacter pallidicorallinus]PRY53975.1 starch phosphorylase [Arcticibacter pallidicorallinus]